MPTFIVYGGYRSTMEDGWNAIGILLEWRSHQVSVGELDPGDGFSQHPMKMVMKERGPTSIGKKIAYIAGKECWVGKSLACRICRTPNSSLAYIMYHW